MKLSELENDVSLVQSYAAVRLQLRNPNPKVNGTLSFDIFR